MLGIVNLAAGQKGRIWVSIVFLVAGLENVRLYVKLVTKFGTPTECMYVFATLWLNVGQIKPEICDCTILKGHSLYSR